MVTSFVNSDDHAPQALEVTVIAAIWCLLYPVVAAVMRHPRVKSPLFPYTTLFRSLGPGHALGRGEGVVARAGAAGPGQQPDRKSTRLNSSHVASSYAGCCLN